MNSLFSRKPGWLSCSFLAPTRDSQPLQIPGLLATVQDGRVLLEFLLAQGPTKRTQKIDVQRVAPRGALPEWLMEDFALRTAVAADKRIVIGPANTPDERIAPFMAGRHD